MLTLHQNEARRHLALLVSQRDDGRSRLSLPTNTDQRGQAQ